MRSIHKSLRRCNVLANGENHSPPHNHNNDELKFDIDDNEAEIFTNNLNPLNHDPMTKVHEKKSPKTHRIFKGLNEKGKAPTRGNVSYSELVTTENDLKTAVGWGVFPGVLVNALKLLGLPTVRETIRRVFQRTESQVRNRGSFLQKCLVNEARVTYPSYTFKTLEQLYDQLDIQNKRFGGYNQ